jgi:four helix bundle protein
MGVLRFEDLRVWQAALIQCNRVGGLIRRPTFAQDSALSEHLNAASLSVMNNISEGFLRGRDREFRQFLRIAAGSNGEVRALFHAARGRQYLDLAEADDLIEASNAIGRMIRRLSDTLKP